MNSHPLREPQVALFQRDVVRESQLLDIVLVRWGNALYKRGWQAISFTHFQLELPLCYF